MVSSTDTLRIDGLRQFSAALKAIEPGLQKELKAANLAAGALVKTAAVARAARVGGVAVLAAKSIRISGTAREASIRIGGNTRAGKVALGGEYGSLRWHQFKPWLGNSLDAGYFLWPSIREQADNVAAAYGQALERLAAKAFPQTS